MANNESRARIARAAETTRRVAPGYFEKTLAQRAELSGQAAGSLYEGISTEELEHKLLSAEWESYSHEAVTPGCSAFKAPLPGRLGVVDLHGLPLDSVVTLDDRKNTAKVSAVVSGVRGEIVDFTVLILGLEQGEEVIFTLHPGDPVRPSQVQATPGLHGKTVSVREALDMGLTTAKVQ